MSIEKILDLDEGIPLEKNVAKEAYYNLMRDLYANIPGRLDERLQTMTDKIRKLVHIQQNITDYNSDQKQYVLEMLGFTSDELEFFLSRLVALNIRTDSDQNRRSECNQQSVSATPKQPATASVPPPTPQVEPEPETATVSPEPPQRQPANATNSSIPGPSSTHEPPKRRCGDTAGSKRGPYKKNQNSKKIVTVDDMLKNRKMLQEIDQILGHRKKPDLEFKVVVKGIPVWLPAYGVRLVNQPKVDEYLSKQPKKSKADLLRKHMEIFGPSMDENGADSDDTIILDEQ